MKLSILEYFEEKFYFKTSHIFWHLLIGIGGLTLIIGILILLWGITPSFKSGVKKEKYPEPVKVNVQEISIKIQPPVKKTSTDSKTSKPIKSKTDKLNKQPTKTEDPAEITYLASIDSMKVLIPPAKYPWKSKGHYEHGYYRKTWVTDVFGIEGRLKSIFKKVNANNFESKRQIIDVYINLIAPFPENLRYTVLKSAIEFSKTDVTTTLTNMVLLQSALQNFSMTKANFIKTLATFGRKNPRDGQKFITYVNNIISKFQLKIRERILTTLVNSYYKHFNKIEKQKEATNLFLEINENFKPENQAKALSAYYKLYCKKNYNRNQKIDEIEYKYNDEQNRAQSVLNRKKLNKAKYRTMGLSAIGTSVIFIALVALFLVLLSIQRNIKLLREEPNEVKLE